VPHPFDSLIVDRVGYRLRQQTTALPLCEGFPSRCPLTDAHFHIRTPKRPSTCLIPHNSLIPNYLASPQNGPEPALSPSSISNRERAFMTQLFSHIRFALRQLRKSPVFAFTTVLTLALGIGATTAIFSLVYAVMLKPLPFPHQDRLTWLAREDHASGTPIPGPLSYPNFFDWRTQNHTFSGIASYNNGTTTLTRDGDALHLNVEQVSSNLFQVLGVAPILGRDFRPEDETPGHRTVMLSYDLWQSRFGGDPRIVGQTITLDGLPSTVAGVMPKSFNFPIVAPAIEVWTSLAELAEDADPVTNQRSAEMIELIGRLKPGVTLVQARADLNVVSRNLAAQYPDDDKWITSVQVALEFEHLVGSSRTGLRVLFGAVAMVLLIACVNVAGLLLARGARRTGEIALRAALGASRVEIVRQMLVESLLLSLLGGLAGVTLAEAFLQGALRFLPNDLPRLNEVSLNPQVLAFAIGLAVLTGLLFGILPALRISHLDPSLALREGTRSVAGGRGQHRLQTVLVIGETALGLVLLVGAGLLIRSFVSVLHVDPGFDPHGVFTARLNLPDNGYKHDQKIQFFDQLMPRIAALPGVKSVSAGWPLPMAGGGLGISFALDGYQGEKADRPVEQAGLALPGFFETMRIPLVAGRTFTAQDKSSSAPVAIVSQAFANKYFAGANPIGKHIQPGLGDGTLDQPVREIVGVVGNIKRRGLTTQSDPQFYLPWSQAVITMPYLTVRTSSNPQDIERSVHAIVTQMDPNIPMYKAQTLDYYVSQSAAQPRFQTLLVTSFAAMALLLTAIGLYGVLSYIVQQRALELALRLAMGAQRGDVLQLVLKRGMGLAAIGVAAGLAISFFLTRFISTLLYGIRPTDALTFAGVSFLLLLVALAASFAPAYRASQTDPMHTLRNP
jgi:putative ABC transport system permease protein